MNPELKTMNHQHPTFGAKTPVSPAFSLIETVLALGIMGLAVTALLGLLPHGIQMSKKAADAGAQTRIIDFVSARLANMSYQEVLAQDNQRVFFDDQGVQLLEQDMQSTIYVARVRAFSGTNGVTLPGGLTAEPMLARVIVQVTNVPNVNFNFDTALPGTFQSVPLLFGPTVP
jgi:uncharacterized protein (TIGR02598 family)